MSMSMSMSIPMADPELPSQLFECPYPEEVQQLEALPSPEVGSGQDFYFETDHEALRANPDYLALLQTFSVLQAQKMKAIRDREVLVQARERALERPLEVVQHLQAGRGLDLPGRQVVAEIPANIDWEKYHVAAGAVGGMGGENKKIETRFKGGGVSGAQTDSDDLLIRESLEPVGGGAKVERTVRGQFLVRGRVFDEKKKPKTFNQPWTPEEQKRLEELLHKFPSEDVEMERWKKIAAALGNRTAVQVQSRTQKYFVKLQKAGLPIPGRLGKSKNRYYNQAGGGGGPRNPGPAGRGHSGHKKSSLIGQKNSSFFPDLRPSVKMEEDYDDESMNGAAPPAALTPALQQGILNDKYYLEHEDVSDEENVPESMKQTEGYKELMWLKRIRREKELEQQSATPLLHHGFRCDGCNQEPILGGRFQCSDCLDTDTVDFCCNCAPKGLEIGNHKKDHKLKPVRIKVVKTLLVDRDYIGPSASSSRNYLDPNFGK